MRENLTTGSTPFRKAYLRSLIDVIEVDEKQVASRAARMYWKGRSWLADRGLVRFADELLSGAPFAIVTAGRHQEASTENAPPKYDWRQMRRWDREVWVF
jgi:hypothetical protein